MAVTPSAVNAGWSAGELIKVALPEVDGRGGGKKDLAQGAGSRPAGVPAAIDAIRAALAAGGA